MHEFLRSIGFSGTLSKKQLDELVNWVLEAPGHLSVVSRAASSGEANLAVAEREVAGRAGILVAGEMDEHGKLIPEYYFPYLKSAMISSEAGLSVEKQAARDAYTGMCEDYRMGMALIFAVTNIADAARNAISEPMRRNAPFKKVCFAALASDAVVILPLLQTEKVLKPQSEDSKDRLYHEAEEGNVNAQMAIEKAEEERYHRALDRLRDTDIFTVVESFFMPHGMESERYYLMGKIVSSKQYTNQLTNEDFYDILIEVNGMPLSLAVSRKDLTGEPVNGARLKAHIWLMGELRR